MQHLLQRFAAKMKGDSREEVFRAVTGALFTSNKTVKVRCEATGSHGQVLSMLGNDTEARGRKN